jgi:hypothetical protein
VLGHACGCCRVHFCPSCVCTIAQRPISHLWNSKQQFRDCNRLFAGIRKCTRKRGNKPHVWVYVDRMDAMRSPNIDVSIVRTIFENLPDALFKTHIAMTHAACKPPETNDGPVPYEEWNAQRQNILRSIFSHCTGDQSSQWLCLLAENHHRCRTNAVGEPVLPNGVTWRTQFLAGICVAAHNAKASGLRPPGARKAPNPVEQQQDMVRRLMQQVLPTSASYEQRSCDGRTTRWFRQRAVLWGNQSPLAALSHCP